MIAFSGTSRGLRHRGAFGGPRCRVSSRNATHRLTRILTALLVLGLVAFTAVASMEPTTLGELVRSADSVVRASVRSLESYWEDGAIWTDVSVSEVSYIVGSGPEEKTLRVPGGIVGGVVASVSHVPEFSLGEEVVLFLTEGFMPLVGWTQGKFTIVDGLVVEAGLSTESFANAIVQFREDPDLHRLQQVDMEAGPAMTPPFAGPFIEYITPSGGPAHASPYGERSAADSTVVHVVGMNFGSYSGESEVTFWSVGAKHVQACIESWTDDEIVVRVPGRASSGAVTVRNELGPSNTVQFNVTYSYGGRSWPGTEPMTDMDWPNQRFVYVNPEVPGALQQDVIAAVRAAMNTWNTVPSASFSFYYGGPTTVNRVDFSNRKNTVFWTREDIGVVAVCWTWYYSWDPGRIVKFDVVLNADVHSWSAHGSLEAMDIQAVVTHELGHALQLLDLYGAADSEKTMYGYVTLGETKKRSLHRDDIAGITYVYPGQPGQMPAVNIPDPRLERALRDALGICDGDITLQALAQLRDLTVTDAGVRNLEGLQYATGLHALNVSGNEVRDLEPLVENCRLGGIGAGTHVDLRGNLLDTREGSRAHAQLAELLKAGVTVDFAPQQCTGESVETHCMDLAEGWHLISLSLVPEDATPSAVFGALPGTLYLCTLDDRSEEWLTVHGGGLTEVQSLKGYWLWVHHPSRLCIEGAPPVAEHQVTLGAAGWKMIGVPYPISWGVDSGGRMIVYKNGQARELADAVSSGWLHARVWGYVSATEKWEVVDIRDGTRLEPWRGYWIYAHVEDLAIEYVPQGPATSHAAMRVEVPTLPDPGAPPLPPAFPRDPAFSFGHIMVYPNPARSVDHAIFEVQRPAAALVGATRVRVIDISGTAVFRAVALGPRVEWDLRDATGRVVPNGLYLCIVEIRIGDDWLALPVQKLLVVR